MIQIIFLISFLASMFAAYAFGKEVGGKETEVKSLIKAGSYARRKGHYND